LAKKNRKIDVQDKKTSIMPDVKEEEKSIRVPIIVVKYGIGVLCLIIICMIGAFVHYRQVLQTNGAEKAELELLRQNNAAQVTQIEQLSQTTMKLQADMERLNSLDTELRRIVNTDDMTNTSRSGLPRNSGTYTGQGGPQSLMTINEISNATNSLQVVAKEREESLTELKQELLDKEARMASRPSIWPTMGDITSRFGWRNSPDGNGSSDYHPGIDIANSIGTPIVATADGKVVISGRSSGYGNLIQIDHGNGISTLYGHNSQLLVQVGQMVKKGQIISYMGSTGYSTGSHVHYEVRVNGTAVDPSNFLN